MGYSPAIADFGNGPELFAVGYPHDPPFPIETDVVRHRNGHWESIGLCGRYVSILLPVQEASGTALYAIGDMTQVAGLPAFGIARFDGQSWTTFGGPEFNGVHAVVADLGLGDRIYCSGLLWDGLNRSGIYRWDHDHWTFIGAPDPNPPPLTPPYITCLGVFDDGRGDALYIGGVFRGFAGLTTRNVVRYDGQGFERLSAGILGEPKFLGGYRDIRGWTLFIGGDVLTGASGGTLHQSNALWVGCKEGNCYPNCDLSQNSAVLSANDFVCFLNAFVRRDPYANCDNSTADPTINVNDFTCFVNKFAAGCP